MPASDPHGLVVSDVLLMHNTCSLDYALMKLNKLPAEMDVLEASRTQVQTDLTKAEAALAKAPKKN